jgi:hypothetical protein
MSLTNILQELSKLSDHERLLVRDRIDDLANDVWQDDDLADADKRMILERIKRSDRDPSSHVPWEEAKARMQSRLGAW